MMIWYDLIRNVCEKMELFNSGGDQVSLPVCIYIEPTTHVEIDTTYNSEENLTVTHGTNNMVENHDLFYMDVQIRLLNYWGVRVC